MAAKDSAKLGMAAARKQSAAKPRNNTSTKSKTVRNQVPGRQTPWDKEFAEAIALIDSKLDDINARMDRLAAGRS